MGELAQSIGAWTRHKSNFTGKMPQTKSLAYVRASLRSRHARGRVTRAILCSIIFMQNAAGQDQAKLVVQSLCEPARSKCTWTPRKSNLMREFRGNMPRADGASRSSARTPQCGRIAWGKNGNYVSLLTRTISKGFASGFNSRVQLLTQTGIPVDRNQPSP